MASKRNNTPEFRTYISLFSSAGIGCYGFKLESFECIATILLTSSQHRQKAHPNGNTQIINRDYQYMCLLAKSRTIEQSLIKGSDFYRKEAFVHVINVGFDLDDLFYLPNDSSFAQIRDYIINYYSSH